MTWTTHVMELRAWKPPNTEKQLLIPGFISPPQWALFFTKCFLLVKVNTTFHQNPSLTYLASREHFPAS